MVFQRDTTKISDQIEREKRREKHTAVSKSVMVAVPDMVSITERTRKKVHKPVSFSVAVAVSVTVLLMISVMVWVAVSNMVLVAVSKMV